MRGKQRHRLACVPPAGSLDTLCSACSCQARALQCTAGDHAAPRSLLQLLINGKFEDAKDGKTFENLDPRTGELQAAQRWSGGRASPPAAAAGVTVALPLRHACKPPITR